VRRTGAYLVSALQALGRRHNCGEVRGKGLLLALELGAGNGGDVVKEAFERGLLINSPRPHSLRFMPALNVTPAEIDRMIALLDESLAAAARGK